MNKTIFDQQIFEINDSCFCLASSIDKPHIYLKFKCIVRKRRMFDDRVVYYCEITHVFEKKKDVQFYLHNMRFRFHHSFSKRGHLKRITCFDLLEDFEAFDINFNERFKKHLLIVPNILIAKTEKEINSILIETTSIIKDTLRTNLSEINSKTIY